MNDKNYKIPGKEKKVHILIVDDDPLMLRLFGGKLADKGFEILYAHDGNEGREIARRMDVDLVLLDYRMPVQDGMETLDRLKGEDITKDIPVIMLTNQDLSWEGERAIREMGVADYIQKGVTTDELVERINKVLKTHQSQSQKSEQTEG